MKSRLPIVLVVEYMERTIEQSEQSSEAKYVGSEMCEWNYTLEQ